MCGLYVKGLHSDGPCREGLLWSAHEIDKHQNHKSPTANVH